MKAFKAFVQPFETPERSVKIKIEVNFFFSYVIGARKINFEQIFFNKVASSRLWAYNLNIIAIFCE